MRRLLRMLMRRLRRGGLLLRLQFLLLVSLERGFRIEIDDREFLRRRLRGQGTWGQVGRWRARMIGIVRITRRMIVAVAAVIARGMHVARAIAGVGRIVVRASFDQCSGDESLQSHNALLSAAALVQGELSPIVLNSPAQRNQPSSENQTKTTHTK